MHMKNDCNYMICSIIKNCVVYILLILISIIATSKPVQAAVNYLVTVTATSTSNIPYPIATLSTPLNSVTPSGTQTITPTTTLVPLPAITLIFPAPTSTARVTPTQESISNLDYTVSADVMGENKISPRIQVLTVLMVILWLFLVGFVILFIRQFK